MKLLPTHSALCLENWGMSRDLQWGKWEHWQEWAEKGSEENQRPLEKKGLDGWRMRGTFQLHVGYTGPGPDMGLLLQDTEQEKPEALCVQFLLLLGIISLIIKKNKPSSFLSRIVLYLGHLSCHQHQILFYKNYLPKNCGYKFLQASSQDLGTEISECSRWEPSSLLN